MCPEWKLQMDFLFHSTGFGRYGDSRYGWSTVYSPIGDLLQVQLADYGSAIETFLIVAYLLSAPNTPPPTPEYHEYLATLPKVAFQRKRKRVRIEFVSTTRTGEDDESNRFSVEATNAAMVELSTLVPMIEKRLKRGDDFDYARFIADSTQVLLRGFASEEEIAGISVEARQKRMAALATKNWWESADIDWDKYDPKARAILDDAFFWDCADDFAPHGNDTGADLLVDYCKWAKRNPQASPMAFLGRLFTRWGIVPIDWSLTDEEEVRKVKETKGMELSVSNEAIVALAFAVIKSKGECPTDVSDLALRALQRDSYAFIEDGMTDKNKELHRAAIAKMTAKLERL